MNSEELQTTKTRKGAGKTVFFAPTSTYMRVPLVWLSYLTRFTSSKPDETSSAIWSVPLSIEEEKSRGDDMDAFLSELFV